MLSILLQSDASIQSPIDTSSSASTTTLSPPLYRFLFIAIGLMAFFWLVKTIIRVRAMIELWTALKRQEVIRLDGLRHIGQLSRDNLQQIMRSRSTHIPSHVQKMICHGHILTESCKLQDKHTEQEKSQQQQGQQQGQAASAPSAPQCTLTFQISTSAPSRVDVYVGVAHTTINQLYAVIEKNKKKLSKPMKKKSMKGKDNKKTINVEASPEKPSTAAPTTPSPIAAIPRGSMITSTDVSIPTVHDDAGIGLGLAPTTNSGITTTSHVTLDTTTIPTTTNNTVPTPSSPKQDIEMMETRGMNEPLLKSNEYTYKANSIIIPIGMKQDIEISLPRSVFNKLDMNTHPLIIHVIPLDTTEPITTDESKQGGTSIPHAVTQITLSETSKTIISPTSDDISHIKFEKQLIVSSTAILETLDLFGLEDDSNECIVCLTDPKEIILLPCRHVALCAPCHENVTKCPVCRAAINNYMRFLPHAEAMKIGSEQ